MTAAHRTTYEDIPAVILGAGAMQGALWPMLADKRDDAVVIASVLGARAAGVGLFCMAVERAEVRRA